MKNPREWGIGCTQPYPCYTLVSDIKEGLRSKFESKILGVVQLNHPIVILLRSLLTTVA